MWPGARSRPPALDPAAVLELQAALEAGAAPSAALTAVAEQGPLAGVVRAVRLGQPLDVAAAQVDSGDPVADLLVRALGVSDRAGVGAAAAVEQAVAAGRDEAALARMLRVRTAQARGTAVVLAVLPVCAWLLLVMANGAALRFYTTVPGLATAAAALALAGAGRWWSARLVTSAELAAGRADPLTPRQPPVDRARIAVVALPAALVAGLLAGPVAGVAAGAAVAGTSVWHARRAHPAAGPSGSGGAAETLELVSIAISAGLPPHGAIAAVAPLAPPVARPALEAAARRLRHGWAPDAAFADSGLARLGLALAASSRWGAPAAPALCRLAADLRAERRAAAEEAAERTQLALVFPTTLLTLPSFVLGVVPPLLWTAFTTRAG